MRSFTFNFSVALLTAAGVVGAYGAAIAAGYVPPGPRSNATRQEGFLYGAGKQAAVVVLGSSQSVRLERVALPPDWFVLALESGNARPGLKLLGEAPARPRTLLVEANATIERGPQDSLLADMVQPFGLLVTYVPALQAMYRPLGVLTSAINRARHPGPPPALSPAEFEHWLALYTQTTAPFPPAAAITADVEALARALEAQRKNGARVLLFEPPMHPRLAAAPLAVAYRRALALRFPAPAWTWVRPVPGPDYPTSDGLHLTQAGATRLFADLQAALR